MPADNRRGKQNSLAGMCRGESLMWSHRFLPPQPRAGGVIATDTKVKGEQAAREESQEAHRHPGTQELNKVRTEERTSGLSALERHARTHALHHQSS